MINKISIVLIFTFYSVVVFGQKEPVLIAQELLQEKGEVQFVFEVDDLADLQSVANIISIDKVDGNKVYAYANSEEFNSFLTFDYKYTIQQAAGYNFAEEDMATTIGEMVNWDKYPTYDLYLEMMLKFSTDYPTLCKLDTIGESEQGRYILAVKISDNVEKHEGEPEFFYSSTLHGDETTGYILMLRYIDFLLSNYATSDEVAALVNGMEIYISPNINPDGTYAGGNSTVSGATRSNSNSKDLNRNFPDPVDGIPSSVQKETQSIMNFMEKHNFVMSATFHDVYELVNFPWDAWISSDRKHADHDWFEKISRDYANFVQAEGPSGYFTQQDNGITHGGDWYVVHGGKQDYATYFRNCRDVTIELSSFKIISPDELNNYWNYHKDAITGYLMEANYGIQGLVTTSDGKKVKAKISIENHDLDNSLVYTDSVNGDYYRPIEPGTYTLTYEAKGYFTQTHSITVDAYKTTVIKNVELKSESSLVDNSHVNSFAIYPNPVNEYMNIEFQESVSNKTLSVYNSLGMELSRINVNSNTIKIETGSLPSGTYYIKVLGEPNIQPMKFIKN